MIYTGIDVSKSSARCVFLDNEGEKLKAFSVGTDKEGFDKLLASIKELKLNKDNSLFGIEATGILWENLFSFLTELDFKVILLNPYQTKKYREALRFKAKTDDIDAYVIAGLLRSKDFSSSFIPEDRIQALRDFTKLRYELVKDRTNYQRQALSLLTLVFPEYSDTALKNPFGIASLAVLKQFPTAKHIAATKVKQIEAIVRSIKGNNFSVDNIQHLIDTAKSSVFSGRASDARALNLNILLSQIESFNNSITSLDAQIETLLTDDQQNNTPSSNLLDIPGVGPKTVAAMLSAVGYNGKSFHAGSNFIGYIGFFPIIRDSGETKLKRHIAKTGPKYLRWALYLAAVSCIKHNEQFKRIYQIKRSQGKSAKQALICVAVKLAHTMLSMLKSGKPYDPKRVFACSWFFKDRLFFDIFLYLLLIGLLPCSFFVFF